ncbi:hypothetical protein ACELLULO517_18285 [Acidisoma cellulosilytica]|uniref:Uncharacterized protein n=1 Tax=Acidisoma cellulosilyticum TaxID=2802395 RepID=A0A963Z458_9PROT|nr:hypothetical protein [Acidisoma cellulosilyticum]MCB8882201.1 hypothetical protein [Acidisoma cellulosilyticum]
MKLVWHANNLLEADWIRDLLGTLIDQEALDLDCSCFDDNTIHVVSSNWKPLPQYESYFAQCRSRCKTLILFHASDEYFSGGNALYRHFDLVLRNFRTYLTTGPGILSLPFGYSNGTRRSGDSKPAKERRYAWSFTGEIKASRIDMAAAMEGFGDNLFTRTASIDDAAGRKLSKAEFDAILSDTVFSPCPMGNVILETWRLYESLELGCIPLIERRPSLDYYRTLLGDHPVPTFASWRKARLFAETLYADKHSLAQLQTHIGDWWATEKGKLRATLQTAIAGPSQSAALNRFAALPHNRYPVLYEPLRLAELLRHQSTASLRRRLMRPTGPLKRITRDALRLQSRKPAS